MDLSFVRIVLLMALAAYAHTASAEELITAQCNGCTTLQQLLNRARGEALDAIDPDGRNLSRFNIFVTSDVAPLSAMYLVVRRVQGPFGPDLQYYPDISPTTKTLTEAYDLDEAVFSRKIEPVEIPSNWAGSANDNEWENVSTYLRRVLPVEADIGGGYSVRDLRTGRKAKINPTITVTVKFEDGTTAKVIISASTALASQAWYLVPGSIRQPTAATGGPRHNFSFGRASFGWRSWSTCVVETTVCAFGSCDTRRYYAVCR